MPTLKLTQAAVDKLTWSSALTLWRAEKPEERAGKEPASRRVEIWDTLLPGFGPRITDRDGKVWQCLFRVKGKMVRESLGSFARVPKVEDAREAARRSMTKARDGVNPVVETRQAEAEKARQTEAEEARKAATLAAAIKRYLAERPKVNAKGKPLAVEYLAEVRRTLERDVARSKLGERPMAELEDGKAIKALLRDMAKKRSGHSRHVHAYLSTAAEWFVDEGLTGRNIMAGIKPPAPKGERDRALEEDHELRLFWQACDEISWPFGPLFKLLLLLGPRRDELACATWREFDLAKQTWELPGSRSKNGLPQITHLPALAVEIIEAIPCIASPHNLVFTTNGQRPVSGFGRAAARVEAIMQGQAEKEGLPPIVHFTRHDLRRSLAVGMAKLGVAPHVADKVLNHSGGTTITGVAKIYNRFQYLDERKAALDLWAGQIEKLVGIERPEKAPEVSSPQWRSNAFAPGLSA
jgi:integrase